MTIKEIAAMCGVSRGTVDRVLNHRGRVKPETEQAVRAALEQAGYTKNIAGRALTVRRLAPRIGVVLCCLGNPFFDEVLKGISQAEEELQDWGVRVELRLLRGYDAASHGRLNAGWRVFNESAELTDRYSRDPFPERRKNL